ncbi:G-protein coupled receptor Mth2-like isoform X2 [Ischnura elegans]|uniref:G-protein coupled receptor Mth2-like isoform X2 n=1 Tax=Ischnura elegans TaxID=197161 RepID=UPI001ED870EE|nr:G-protein coupled receptor Mth2-like isoform X2 [Ischnura elegans]
MGSVTGGLLLLLLSAVAPASTGNSCCPDGAVLIKPTRMCESLEGNEGATEWQLNCTNGVYIMNPEKDPWDHFEVMDDGQLKTGKGEYNFYLPPHVYCVSRMKRDNVSEPTDHEVAFVCFAGDTEGRMVESDFWRIMYGTLEGISAFFLLITLSVYLLLPELRDLQGRCIMSTVLSQLIGFFTLSMIQFMGYYIRQTGCIVSAFFLYFWMLASFFWLTVISFNVWRSVRFKTFPLTDRQLFWYYCAFGWLFPCAFLLATLITHHLPESHENVLRANFGVSKCWFQEDIETWVYFYAPMTVLLAFNITFFTMTALRLWRRSDAKDNIPGLRASRFKCLLYVKLCVVMGVPWIFEVISFMYKSVQGHWRIADTINALQGLLIFLVVVCRRRVVQALAKRQWSRKVVCALCPRRCTAGPDAELDAPMLHSAEYDEASVPMESAAMQRT